MAGGTGSFGIYFGIPATIGTNGGSAVVLATGVTGDFFIQAINEGSVDALVSFDGEQVSPTYGLKVPAGATNSPPWVIHLNNSTILLSRGNANSDVSGFSLVGMQGDQ